METSFTSIGFLALLGFGLVFGLKHATEVDHVVAVSAIVSEHRNVLRSALVGALWGLGHTASLVIVGVLVLVFRVAIPNGVVVWLELGVGIMIVALGVIATVRVFRKRPDVHLHRHSHDGQSHVHIHFHEHGTEHDTAAALPQEGRGLRAPHSHAISQIGFKPLLVGAMHGLAGSAALTLLVLTQVRSVAQGLLYLAVFGFGSTLGMLLMSGLIGLPFALSARRLSHFHHGLQAAAGCLSVAFGVWYAYASVAAAGVF